jgi:hypothetical protein
MDIIDLIKREGESSDDDEVTQDKATKDGDSLNTSTKVASY